MEERNQDFSCSSVSARQPVKVDFVVVLWDVTDVH